jgi:hypothetical protein
MIFFLKTTKFKATKYQSAEKLREATGVDEVVDAEKLNKELAKGNNVYCWISPYNSEIEGQLIIHWGLDPDAEMSLFHQSAEEI